MNIFHFKRKALGYVYRCGNPDGTDAFSNLDLSNLPPDAFEGMNLATASMGAGELADSLLFKLLNKPEPLTDDETKAILQTVSPNGIADRATIQKVSIGGRGAGTSWYINGKIVEGGLDTAKRWAAKNGYTLPGSTAGDFANRTSYSLERDITKSQWYNDVKNRTPKGMMFVTLASQAKNFPQINTSFTNSELSSNGQRITDWGNATALLWQVTESAYSKGYTSIEKLMERGKPLNVYQTTAGHGATGLNIGFTDTGVPYSYTTWQDTSDGPQILGAIGVALAFTGAGAALGGAILGTTGTAATLLGNMIINTVLTGGDLEQALKSTAAQWAGSEVGAWAGGAAASIFTEGAMSAAIGNVAGAVTRASIMGVDVEQAAIGAAVGSAIGAATAQIPNFENLDADIKSSITAAITSAAQGGSASEVLLNAAEAGLVTYGVNKAADQLGLDQSELDPKYQQIIKDSVTQGIITGNFKGAALNGLIKSAATAGKDAYNKDRVVQVLKDNGQLPTANYDQLTLDEQELVDRILAENNNLLLTDAQVNSAIKDYLYTNAADVAAAFNQYFTDIPAGMTKAEYYAELEDLGVIDGVDSKGNIIPSSEDLGVSPSLVDDRFSRIAMDLNSALQFDPDLDLGVVQQIYGYNNAEDALAGYLDRVATGKVISNMDDYNAAVEVLNSINKYPNGDPLDAFNEAKGDVGITPEVIESIYPGVTYGEFVQRLDGAYASGDDVIQQFKDITGREPTFEEIATYQGKPEWVTERVIQTNFDRDSVTFDGTGYETAERAAAAARDAGYLAFKWGVSEYQLGTAEAKKELRGVASTNEAFALALTRLNKNQTFTAPDGKTYKVDIPESEKPYNGTSAETKYDAAVSAFVEGKDKFIFGGKIYLVPDDMAERMVIDGMQPTDAQRKYVEESAAEATAPDLVDLTNVARTSIPDIDPDDPEAQLQLTGGLNALESGDAMRKLEGLGLSVAGAVLKAGAGIGHMISPDFKEVELSEDDKALLSAMTGKPVEAFDGPVSSQNLEDTWLYKAGAELQDRGEAAYPQWIKNERAEVFRRLEEAGSEYYDPNISPEIDMQNGMVGETALGGWIKSQYAKGAELFNLATEYPQAVLSIGLEEGGEEILPWAIGGVAYRMGRLSMTGVVTGQSALDIGEATVGGYEEAKQIAFANGASWDEAVAAGSRAGLLAGMAAGAIEPVFNYTLAKTIFDGIGKDLISGITKESFRQVASNQVQGAVENFVAQGEAKGYDNIDLNAVSTNAFIEAIVGSAVTAGLMSGSAIASGFVGTDAAGNPVSYDQFKNGADVANFDLSGLRLEAANGAQLSLGQVGASVVAATPELTGVLVTDDNPYSIEIQDALVFDADEQADWLAERGLGGFGADAYGDVIAGADTELDATNALSDWADPLYMDRAEAQSYLQERGYQGNPEEVEALLRDNGNAVPESEAQSRIDQYVDDHTVTADELRDQLLAENPTLTEEEIQAYTQQGANVNQAQVIADAVASEDATYRTEQEVRDRFAELGLTRITDDDAARFAGDVAEGDSFSADTEAYLPTASQNLFMDYLNTGNLPGAMTSEEVQQIVNSAISAMPPGLSIEEVTTAINEELAKLPESATPDDVNAAIATAQSALSEQITGVQEALQEQYDALSEDQQVLADNLVSQGETLQDAIDAVSVSLGEQISDVEAGLQEQYDALSESQQQLADDLVAQGETLESAISTAQTSLEEQITGVQEDLQAQYDALSESQQELADSLVSQGETLEDAIATAQSSLEEQITGVSEDLQTKYESLTQGQQDLADALVAQGETLESAIATAQSSLEEQITGVQEDVQAKYDSLTEGQQALADQLVAQGETLASAIATAQTSLETQIGDVETALNEKLDTYEQAGIDRDAALSDAIDEVAADLGTTREDILTQLGTTEENIRADMQSAYDALTQQNQELADLLGKPAQEVTQADIDAMNAILAGEQDTNLAYDANQDGVIDQSDIDILTGVLAGTNVDWQAPEESYWAPTGVYGEMAANQSALETQLAELEAQRIADLEAERARQQRIDLSRSFSQLRPAAQQAMQQSMTTTTPIYGRVSDFDISGKFDPTALGKGPFRSPSQYGTNDNKMAQGGYVGDQNLERLLEIING